MSPCLGNAVLRSGSTPFDNEDKFVVDETELPAFADVDRSTEELIAIRPTSLMLGKKFMIGSVEEYVAILLSTRTWSW